MSHLSSSVHEANVLRGEKRATGRQLVVGKLSMEFSEFGLQDVELVVSPLHLPMHLLRTLSCSTYENFHTFNTNTVSNNSFPQTFINISLLLFHIYSNICCVLTRHTSSDIYPSDVNNEGTVGFVVVVYALFHSRHRHPPGTQVLEAALEAFQPSYCPSCTSPTAAVITLSYNTQH